MIVLKKNLIFLPFFLHLQLYLYSMGGGNTSNYKRYCPAFFGKKCRICGVQRAGKPLAEGIRCK